MYEMISASSRKRGLIDHSEINFHNSISKFSVEESEEDEALTASLPQVYSD